MITLVLVLRHSIEKRSNGNDHNIDDVYSDNNNGNDRDNDIEKNYIKSDDDNDCYILWNDSNDFDIQLEKKIWLKYTSPVSSSETKSLWSGVDFVNKAVCFFFFFFLVFLVNSRSRPGGKKLILILSLNHMSL